MQPSRSGKGILSSMRMSWKLGRVAGIDLYLHPTFLFLFLPVLSTGMSPLFLVGVFGCVVLHELGHALMARRFGIGTRDITLYPIGGVARLERMPRAPGAELLIALAGPAVNFAIAAGLLAVLALGSALVQTSVPLGGFLGELLIANLVLGLFNLLPAFPMDGGRVLRALLSGWLGRARATSIAATVGRSLAIVFGVLCLMYSHFPQVFVQLALAAFIYMAAGSEEFSVLAEERRRTFGDSADAGIWVAPPGYRWVDRGNGVWQLAPIIVTTAGPHPGSSSWTG